MDIFSPKPFLLREKCFGQPLTHKIHILQANGESFRLRDSQRRMRRRDKEKKSDLSSDA